MRICIHIDPTRDNQMKWGHAFARGLRAHGEDPQIIESFYSTECDVAVFYAWHPRTKVIQERQLRDGNHFISMDCGWLGDRSKWRGIGFNGQNGRADYLTDPGMDNKRRKRYHWELRPWIPGTEHILVCGQMPGDTSLRGQDHDAWIQETIEYLESIQELPVKFRQHPDPEMPHNKQKASLMADMEPAACVVSFNSNTAVNAVLNGIPAIVLDRGSMAWDVCGHSLDDVTDPPMPDRDQWLNDLAWKQWTLKEIESGAAWEHLKRLPSISEGDE